MAKFHFTTPIGISCKSRSRQLVSCKFCKIFRNKLFQKTYERIYLCCLTKVCFVILQFWSTFLHKHRDTTNHFIMKTGKLLLSPGKTTLNKIVPRKTASKKTTLGKLPPRKVSTGVLPSLHSERLQGK